MIVKFISGNRKFQVLIFIIIIIFVAYKVAEASKWFKFLMMYTTTGLG